MDRLFFVLQVSRKSASVRLACLLFALCWLGNVSSLFAAPVGQLDPLSLNISDITGGHTGVNPGEALRTLEFSFTNVNSVAPTDTVLSGTTDFGYLNLVNTDTNEWLVQDLPIPLVEDFLVFDAIGENNAWFYSDDSPITNAAVILNDTPFGAPPLPGAGWDFFGPAGVPFDWGSDDPAGQFGDGSGILPAPGPPQNPPAIEGYLRGQVGDKKQYRNECGPTSTTNSLLWLIDKHNLSTDRLPKTPTDDVDMDEFLKQLAKDMSPDWNETPVNNNDRGYDGLNDNELVDGKTKFIKDKKLPISVKGGNKVAGAKGKNAFDFIKGELKDGEDVEFLIAWPGGGSHWVTVVGYIDDPTGENTLIVHDPDSKKGGNHYWKLDDNGNFSNPKGSALWAVSESVERDKIVQQSGDGVDVERNTTGGFGLDLEKNFYDISQSEILYAFPENQSAIDVSELITNDTGIPWSDYHIDLDGADFFGPVGTGLLAPEFDPVEFGGVPGDEFLDFFVSSGSISIDHSQIIRDGEGASLWLFFDDPVDPGETFQLIFDAVDVGLSDEAFALIQSPSIVPEPTTLLMSTLAMGFVLSGRRRRICACAHA